ncbi:hypothetical protein E4634_00010 [Mangrovimicrobium sediminis]|uniref:Putative zinc-finger domain-containing protein n=1 Tax=Mangrovimicrobium sediminis TaxID=2562682 RepID=A0A4Z0M9C7_9GAMM|nr:zf-HC2 domain-containing protein [Haliea sp. SAOS-164]TGD75977.1 hypothetical protein E4634_00010 [Haliea sp. SAOS-164]
MNHARMALSHAQVRQLMPGFIHGRLDSQQQREVQEHIASCASCARQHRDDLQLTEAFAPPPRDIELLLTSSRREHNRQQLFAMIDALEPAAAAPASAGPASATRPRRHSTWPLALAAGLAALSVGATLFNSQLDPHHGYQSQSYRTQTAALPGATNQASPASYRVVFDASTTLESIQALLQGMHATVIDGPSAAGVYTLVFPADTPEAELLGELRADPAVLFAEKSVHNDG